MSGEGEGVGRSCSFCGADSSKFRKDHGEGRVVCSNCGKVVEDEVKNLDKEYRIFDTGDWESKERTGAPVKSSIYDKGLSTMVGRKNKDYKDKSLKREETDTAYSLRNTETRYQYEDSKEYNLAKGLQMVEELGSLLNLPDFAVEEAAEVFRKMSSSGLQGYSLNGATAGAVYLACRAQRVPRNLDDIAEFSQVSRKDISRTYRQFVREIGLDFPRFDPVLFVPRFCDELGLEGDVVGWVKQVVRRVDGEKGFVGLTPVSVVAGGIYFVGRR